MPQTSNVRIFRPRAQAAADRIFEQLRDKILSIALPPGTALSRSDLQNQFGLSSTPVRDALMKLEEIGLVDVFPQSRTMVSLIDVGLAREAQLLRRSIELEVIHLLSSRKNAETVRILRDCIADQRRHAKERDLELFNEADLQFHRTMYEAADASRLWELVRRQSVHIDRIRRLHLPITGKAAQIVQDHSGIVKAISENDPVRAQSLLRDHLAKSLAFSEELRFRFPHFFRPPADDRASGNSIR